MIDRGILKTAYRLRLATYEAQQRSSLYVQCLKRAFTYLNKGGTVTLVRPDVWEVYSFSGLTRVHKGSTEPILVYEVSLHTCSCFEATGFGTRPTCSHQEALRLHETVHE